MSDLDAPQHPARLDTASALTKRNGADPAPVQKLGDKQGREPTEAERQEVTKYGDEAGAAIARLEEAVVSDQKVVAVHMEASRLHSPPQQTEAFFEVGGRYRRNVGQQREGQG
jgi:methylmalonyl-CoA mutase